MLDDDNVFKQRDPSDALGVAAKEFEQASYPLEVAYPENDARQISKLVVVGMGGSGLGALVARAWLKSEMSIPFEVIRTYELPHYVDFNTLVIISSDSGNTEEVLAALKQARQIDAQVAIITTGGKLGEIAGEHEIASVILPSGIQPRMMLIFSLRALILLLSHFSILSRDHFDVIAEQSRWLEDQTMLWTKDVSTAKNIAKQFALIAVGKTPVFYGGPLMAPVAYKWKISWNENAKNIAFWNEYPEFNHNEFIGWSSHPIEKPFAIFNLISHLEHPHILKRFEVSDQLLSGKWPKPTSVKMEGDTALAQMLWGSILADFVSIYVAVLNGVDPTPVQLIEKLKLTLQ